MSVQLLSLHILPLDMINLARLLHLCGSEYIEPYGK